MPQRARTIVTLAALSLLVPCVLQAYVVPAEQILQFMAANFAKLDTLVIQQSTTLLQTGENPEKVVEEVLSIKSPNLFHSSVLDSSSEQTVSADRLFRELLIANSQKRLLPRLSEVGIDTQQVAYSRLEGTVAYCIGEKDLKKPKLLVEKARALPLLMVYQPPGQDTGGLIRVRFLDYRKVEQGWVPFEIHYFSGDRWTEKYSVHSVKVNTPLKPSLFSK
ncbi:MAG: hypothetical protein MUC98_00760 [Desulfobacterota bacterium]|jgi:hypothetical protein|nr:hypothetical protein [Thermodesulfobacteriota bacterium]